MRYIGISSLLLVGCVFNNMTATEKLRDSVVGLNDEVRWNRIDLASQRVAPAYQREFRATHHNWHRDLQIADSEIIEVEVGEDREQASSVVAVRWYDMRNMVLAETTLRQKWRRSVNGYVLIAEEVADGNPRLLRIPSDEEASDPREDDESGGEEDGPPSEASARVSPSRTHLNNPGSRNAA